MHKAEHYKKMKLKMGKDMKKPKGNMLTDDLKNKLKDNSIANHKF